MIAKGVLVLSAVLLAVAAASRGTDRVTAYTTEHQYLYEYDSQVASSLSNGEQFSAARARTLVKLTFVDDQTVVCQLERPQIGQWNENFDRPELLHKFDQFDRVEIKSELLEALKLPFTFRFVNGKISDIKFHADDVVASENGKRAVMNVLQAQLTNPSKHHRHNNVDSTGYSFRVNETTIEGACESLYTVQNSEGEDVFNITKSIDFERCQSRPEFRYNYFRHAEPMKMWMREDESLNNMVASTPGMEISSVHEFSVRGDRRQFVVLTGKVSSRYSQPLLSGESVALVTFSTAQIALKKVEQQRSMRTPDFPTKSVQSAMMGEESELERERFYVDGDEAFLRRNQLLGLLDAPLVIENIMKRLVESALVNVDIEEHATRHIVELVTILRRCGRSDIKKVYERLVEGSLFSEKEVSFVRDILTDALALTGTKPAMDFLFAKIRNEELSSGKAASVLGKLMNLQLVSFETTQNLFSLCKDSRMRTSVHLKRTCFLTYGALVNAMCRAESPLQHSDKWVSDKYCTLANKRTIVADLMQEFERASSRADRVMVLKTFGNMGLDVSVVKMEQIVRDLNMDKMVRVQAIDALRLVRMEMPKKIQRVLMPIFMNRREFPEVRMNAIYQIMMSRPEPAVMDMILNEMRIESNIHVKTFVLDLIHKVTSQKIFDEETITKMQTVMKHMNLMKRERPSPTHFFSTLFAVEPTNVRDLAARLNMATMFGNDSHLPKEIMASLDMFMQDRIIPNTLQLGVHTQNLERLFEQLFEAVQSKSFDDIVVRSRRSLLDEYNPVNVLTQLFNRMKIVGRRSSDASTPSVLFYTRWHNLDTFFCLADEDSLPEMLKSVVVDGRLDVSSLDKPMHFAWNHITMHAEHHVRVPTTFGIPMTYSVRMPTLTMLEGSMKPSFADDSESDSSTRVRSLKMHLKAQPKFATTYIAKMELFGPFLSTGVKMIYSLQARLPVHMNVHLKHPTWMPSIEVHLPKESVRLMHFQSRPITFFREWPAKSSDMFVEAREKTLLVGSIKTPLRQLHNAFTEPFSGLKTTVDAHWHGNLEGSNMDWLLSGENSFEVRIVPTSESAKKLRFALNALLKDANELRSLPVPEIETLLGEYSKQLLKQVEQNELQYVREQLERASRRLNNFVQVSLKAEALHGAIDHKAHFDVKTVCDERKVMCMATAEMDVDSDWTLKSTLHFARPELRGILAGLPSEHLVAKADCTFGSTEKNTLRLTVYGRPSSEKLELAKQWINERESRLLELPAVTANDYWILLERHFTASWPRLTQKLDVLVRMLPWTLMPEMRVVQNEPTVMARLTMDRQARLNLHIPSRDLELDFDWHNDNVRTSNRRNQRFYDVVRGHTTEAAECSLREGKFVKSFDGKTYQLPMSTCYTVIAKDCSGTSEPEFALMAKKMSEQSSALKVKFVTKHHNYELFKQGGKLMVKLDGSVLSEDALHEHGIYQPVANKQMLEVRCDFTDAAFRFDGTNVLVRIGNRFVNKQCGICGHYNGDSNDVLRKSDNELTESLRDFHESYIYGDEECERTSVRTELRNASASDSDSMEQEDSYRMDHKHADSDEEDEFDRTNIKNNNGWF